ncbi:MAG: hypothetical protein HC923_09190 [Myxococcales bacterium]|nr:hypothetical protein [Myxococcales bacterium]
MARAPTEVGMPGRERWARPRRALGLGYRDAADAGGSDADAAAEDASGEDSSADGGGQSTEEARLRTGVWQDFGYAVSGSSDIVRLPDGSLEVRLSADFQITSGVPGPILFLSSRDRVGRGGFRADLGDIFVADLTRGQRGPASYPVPEEAANAGFGWIFCEPFSVEMNRVRYEVVQ